MKAKKVGALATRLLQAKERKKELNTQLKDLNEIIRELELDLLHAMHDENLVSAKTPLGAVYVGRQTVPIVQNWDEFYAYIRENNAFHLLERRPARKAYCEELESGNFVPGVDPHSFDEIRTRKS